MDLLLIICLVVTIEPGKCVLYSSVGGMKRTKRAVSGDLVESSKKLKSSAVDGITVSAGQMKNVIKFEENVLATRDDLRDNRWVKDKLSKVRDGGSLDAVKERIFGVKIPKFEEIISLLFQHFTASATSGPDNSTTPGDPIICDDELKTLHVSLSASNNTNDIHCCENGMTTHKTTCGNGTDCATVCGVTPTCAKVVTDPEEGKDYCSNSKTNTRDGRANNNYQTVIMKSSRFECLNTTTCNALVKKTKYSCQTFAENLCQYYDCNKTCEEDKCTDGTSCPTLL